MKKLLKSKYVILNGTLINIGDIISIRLAEYSKRYYFSVNLKNTHWSHSFERKEKESVIKELVDFLEAIDIDFTAGSFTDKDILNAIEERRK